MRGVIIGPQIENVPGRGTLMPTSVLPDPLLLRQCVLYWDMIDWPRYTKVGTLSGEAALLQSEGVLISTSFPQPAWEESYVPRPGEVRLSTVTPDGKRELGAWLLRPEDYVKPQALAFAQNNTNGSGLWSLAQPNPFLVLPPGEMARTLEVELYRAIPVPSRDTPIEKVLDLRRRRPDELRAYRGAIDDLYLETIRSPDTAFAKTRAIEKLQQSVVDLHRVMNETRIGQSVVSVKVELNPVDLWDAATRAAAFGAAGYTIGFASAALGVAIGLASAALRLRVQRVPRLADIPPELSVYAYLAIVDAELGRAGPSANG